MYSKSPGIYWFCFGFDYRSVKRNDDFELGDLHDRIERGNLLICLLIAILLPVILHAQTGKVLDNKSITRKCSHQPAH